jgi:flagellar protein FliT
MVPPDDGLPLPRAARPLIERYAEIAQASREMLSAARDEDWERVGRLEARCRHLIEQLRAAAAGGMQLAPDEQRRRIDLLRGILADDAEVSARSEPWLTQLEHLFERRRQNGAR